MKMPSHKVVLLSSKFLEIEYNYVYHTTSTMYTGL